MHIQRTIEQHISTSLFSGRVSMILGPRQVGKTTLAWSIIRNNNLEQDTIAFSGDYLEHQSQLDEKHIQELFLLVGKKKIIFIDEAQKIPTIGTILKILIDHYGASKHIIVTGSSSIHLLDYTAEPLTGRKDVYTLLPFALHEIHPEKELAPVLDQLSPYLLYGLYPRVFEEKDISSKYERLQELTTSTLYRDILEFQTIKNPIVLVKLLKALALQIGSEVSLAEIATMIQIDQRKVETYIDLLEKSYVIFRHYPLFTNRRKEITSKYKVYFYDLGIRNMLINNFNFPHSRNDIGALWENFVILERLKWSNYHKLHHTSYFWKGYQEGEVDLVEEENNHYRGYEIKWNTSLKNISAPKSFMSISPETSFQELSKLNSMYWLLHGQFPDRNT